MTDEQEKLQISEKSKILKNNKIKIVLCTTPQRSSMSRKEGPLPVVPKIAIVSLLRWMAKFGYSGDFYDIDMLLPSADEIFNYFKSKQPDVVGISAVVSTSYLQVKTISKIIRRSCPSAWIVLGGNMAASANVLLRKTEVDICVLGDGEKPWVSILDYVSRHGSNRDVEKLLKIKGIAFLNEQDEMEFTGYGEPISGDENPFPDYELLSKGLLSQPYLVENYFREGKECDWFT
ncbi:cobalamin-dependent protein, partial [bacterium]|nr:cobalamin-dependent protein [bacterium]